MAENTQTSRMAERFNNSHSARLRSATLERVHQTAFGDDYAVDTYANGFYSGTTLRKLRDGLRLEPNRTLADLGCGHGGPGLWVAKQTGAALIGIDISSVGVDLAREQAVHLGIADRARFQVGDMTATGLPDASCDAVLSLDVLIFVPDKIAAVREFVRILRTGGTLGFTTWEQSGYNARLGVEQLGDHRPLLEAAGFAIDAYEEPPEWRRQQTALAEGLIAAELALANEMDAAYAAGFAAMARGNLAEMPVRRYVRAIVTKR